MISQSNWLEGPPFLYIFTWIWALAALDTLLVFNFFGIIKILKCKNFHSFYSVTFTFKCCPGLNLKICVVINFSQFATITHIEGHSLNWDLCRKNLVWINQIFFFRNTDKEKSLHLTICWQMIWNHKARKKSPNAANVALHLLTQAI